MSVFDSLLLRLPTALVRRIRAGLERDRAKAVNAPRIVAHLTTRLDQIDAALQARGVDYVIGDDGRSIVCTVCHQKSWHPLDVREKYCGRCHVFHHDVA